MEIKRFVVGKLEENCWIASSPEGGCMIVDPGQETAQEMDALSGFLTGNGLEPSAVLITHGHMDHVYGVAPLLERYNVPVYMAEADKATLEYFDRVKKFGIHVPEPFPFVPVAEGMKVEAPGLSFKAIATPGHSPGGVCWLSEEEGIMFTGDTLFAGTIGRTDLIYGDYDELIRSVMEKLMTLDGSISILPGHGPDSTIARERTSNPFLEPFNEREEIPELNQEDTLI